MRLITPSRTIVAAALILAGAGAILHWSIYAVRAWQNAAGSPAHGVAFTAAIVFAPSALAGLLALLGGLRLRKGRGAGRIMATSALLIGGVYAALWGVGTAAALRDCRASPAGCGSEIATVCLACAAVIAAVYLIVAVWAGARSAVAAA